METQHNDQWNKKAIKNFFNAIDKLPMPPSQGKLEATEFAERIAENGWEYKVRINDDVLWYNSVEDKVRSTKELFEQFKK